MMTNKYTSGKVAAPMESALREQTLCGTISPKTTISPVVAIVPTTPDAMLSSRTAAAGIRGTTILARAWQ